MMLDCAFSLFSNRSFRTLAHGAAALALLAGLTACASSQKPVDTASNEAGVNDPYEGMNRKVFNFNMKLDKYLLQPVARGYRDTLPDWTRSAIRSTLDNLATPVTLANDLLQGDFDRAGDTVSRFTINTLYGPLGVRDLAAENGIKPHGEDFGQTLAVWGVDSGPYLVLPFFGPSSPRDAGGMVVDVAFNPLTYVDLNDYFWVPITLKGLDVVDERSRTLDALTELQNTSIDFYASIRSLYTQARANAIRNGEMDDTQLPDL
jgi:phospholipid-binding lipoprotein MlaA